MLLGLAILSSCTKESTAPSLVGKWNMQAQSTFCIPTNGGSPVLFENTINLDKNSLTFDNNTVTATGSTTLGNGNYTYRNNTITVTNSGQKVVATVSELTATRFVVFTTHEDAFGRCTLTDTYTR